MLICRIMEQLHPMGMNHLFRRAASFDFVSWVACIDTQTNWLVLKRWWSGWGGISFVQFHHWSVLKRTSTRFLTWYWSLKEDERRNHTIPLMESIFIRLFWTSLSLSFSIELSPLVLAFFFFFLREIGQNMTRSITACASDDGKVERKWIKR